MADGTEQEPFAIVSETRVVEMDNGRFKVVYNTEGYRTTNKTKSIVGDRETAERIARYFDGTELDRDFFIP